MLIPEWQFTRHFYIFPFHLTNFTTAYFEFIVLPRESDTLQKTFIPFHEGLATAFVTGDVWFFHICQLLMPRFL